MFSGPISTSGRSKKTKAVGIPCIDLNSLEERSKLSQLVVHACEEYGFFKVVSHGVPNKVIEKMDKEAADFFGKEAAEKQRAGPACPFGYGCRNIGPNGDTGELEYLLLHTASLSISEQANPSNFSCAANKYTQAVQELACEILELAAEGLCLREKHVFSRLIKDAHNDSLLRLNFYPPSPTPIKAALHSLDLEANPKERIGFGEHSDPQILTVLRSNDVGGLQICMKDGLWVPVPPDPCQFFVLVGDVLQVLTNGRFLSVRHRAMANQFFKPRISTVYFGSPPLHACISPLSELLSPQRPSLYRSFTWSQYKKAMYSLRLGESRLDLFKIHDTINHF